MRFVRCRQAGTVPHNRFVGALCCCEETLLAISRFAWSIIILGSQRRLQQHPCSVSLLESRAKMLAVVRCVRLPYLMNSDLFAVIFINSSRPSIKLPISHITASSAADLRTRCRVLQLHWRKMPSSCSSRCRQDEGEVKNGIRPGQVQSRGSSISRELKA